MSFAQNRFNEMLTNRDPNILYAGISFSRETGAALGAIVFRKEAISANQSFPGVDMLTADTDEADAIKVYEDVSGARVIDGPGLAGTAMIVVPGGTTTPFFEETRVLLYNGLATIQEPPVSPVPPAMPPIPH
jgi:hypothetical protein